jgi:NAD+ diphosphatase
MIAFSGNDLDRASDRRSDPAWLAAQRSHADARFLPFWQMKPLLTGDPPRAAFLPAAAIEKSDALCVFLGLDGSEPEGRRTPLFAVDLGAGETVPLSGLGEFRDMRAAAFVLPGRDCAVAGQAKAILDWNRRHGFCPNCGTATSTADGGYRRLCPNCGAEHFPRTDPVVIMLPLFEDCCLVGHNKRFPGALFSAFAGFVEPGETAEEAVRRELREEVNLRVGAVHYHASQPWPFPSSLMIGCYAQALSRDFAIDGHEIGEARWLDRADARTRLTGEVQDDSIVLPVSIAIAHHLIRAWAAGQAGITP